MVQFYKHNTILELSVICNNSFFFIFEGPQTKSKDVYLGPIRQEFFKYYFKNNKTNITLIFSRIFSNEMLYFLLPYFSL